MPISDFNPSAVLLISCPDRQGIVAAVTEFIFKHRGNILDLDQHVDRDAGVFLMRVAWQSDSALLDPEVFAREFAPLADSFHMKWELRDPQQRTQIAIMVTRESHCLFDLLARHQAGEWWADIPLVIGNRDDLKGVVERFGIPFHHFPITADNKADQERAEIDLLKAYQIDTVILARYMQVLSPAFLRHFPHRILNIHHSFLPAFPGARPYHAAFARGVKIIGATCHYATADLDEGPIIEQDVIRVTHRDDVQDFIRKGKDAEKIVLSRAVTAHLEHRIIVYENRTVVF
ncbi:MAG TPA: formyltetrahydrofolate deformylase [Kiritimatiellia bacterium]|nr:formyltetrahydrofolate deformylase [Kiritimatiellia bacterium]HMO98897.1 formyltetrahydrofolate deformylase [Kiritimatiellia bacterium]